LDAIFSRSLASSSIFSRASFSRNFHSSCSACSSFCYMPYKIHHNISQPKPLISLLFKIKQDCEWCTPQHYTQTLQRHSLLSKCHTLSQYRRKCIFNNGHKKSMAFATMISKKLTHAQQHSVQISYTNFHPNWTLGMETTGRTSFTAYVSIKPIQQHYMEILYFKFHPNQSRNINLCP
jgi:hypothetical protein